MKRRGRPKTDDILTPREWEVLALLRRGLSNPEIAASLNISLSGAKHHVSEILAKLDVGSREEAAAQSISPQRRWGLSPLGLLSTWSHGAASIITPKLAGAAVASLAVVALGAGLLVTQGRGGGRGDAQGQAALAPTPDIFCPPPQCQKIEPKKYLTLEQATAEASFVPVLPAYIPAGYNAYEVTHARFANPPIDRTVHNDWIAVYYRNAAGNRLVVEQGFPSMLGLVAFPVRDGVNSLAKPDAKGSVTVRGKPAHWLKAEPWPTDYTPRPMITDPALGKTGGIVLAWEVGRFGPGWAISPDRSDVLMGSPFSYSVASDVLPLAELLRIAESVAH